MKYPTVVRIPIFISLNNVKYPTSFNLYSCAIPKYSHTLWNMRLLKLAIRYPISSFFRIYLLVPLFTNINVYQIIPYDLPYISQTKLPIIRGKEMGIILPILSQCMPISSIIYNHHVQWVNQISTAMFNSYVKLPEDKYMPIDIPLDHNQIPLNHVQSHANTIKPLWKKGKLKLIGGFTPSEKYEFVNWDDDIPNCGIKKKTPISQVLCQFFIVAQNAQSCSWFKGFPAIQ